MANYIDLIVAAAAAVVQLMEIELAGKYEPFVFEHTHQFDAVNSDDGSCSWLVAGFECDFDFDVFVEDIDYS